MLAELLELLEVEKTTPSGLRGSSSYRGMQRRPRGEPGPLLAVTLLIWPAGQEPSSTKTTSRGRIAKGRGSLGITRTPSGRTDDANGRFGFVRDGDEQI